MIPRLAAVGLIVLALGCAPGGAPPGAVGEAPPGGVGGAPPGAFGGAPSGVPPAATGSPAASPFAGYPPDQGPPPPPLATGIPLAADESAEPVEGGQRDQQLISYLDPGRDALSRPGEVIPLLGLRPGHVVADVGAGSGYWTVHLAQAVAPDGKVLALDQDPHAIWFLRRRLLGTPELARLPVEVRRVEAEDSGLPAGSVDLVFLSDMHIFLGREPWIPEWLRGLGKALKPGGRLVVIEAKRMPHGAPLTREQFVESFQRGGFELLREHDLLPGSFFMEFRPL